MISLPSLNHNRNVLKSVLYDIKTISKSRNIYRIVKADAYIFLLEFLEF